MDDIRLIPDLGLQPGALFAVNGDGDQILFDRQDGDKVYGHIVTKDGQTFGTMLVDAILNKGSDWRVEV